MALSDLKDLKLKLPLLIVGPADINKLLREIEGLEDFLNQAAIRQPGKTLKLPKTSQLFDEFSSLNHLNLLQAEDRRLANDYLNILKHEAPIIHISFASDPFSAFTVKLVNWLRTNIHPQLLLRVGLEPNIAAGCIVRTNSRIYDFSLRKHFVAQSKELIKTLKGQSKE